MPGFALFFWGLVLLSGEFWNYSTFSLEDDFGNFGAFDLLCLALQEKVFGGVAFSFEAS